MRPFKLSDEFYLEVGKLTVAWAQVEIPLDFITGIFFMFAGGTKRLARRLRRPLDQKLTFCRRCLGEVPQLGPFREGLVVILDRVRAIERPPSSHHPWASRYLHTSPAGGDHHPEDRIRKLRARIQ